ncbi:hypothetical protein [Amycolatopsis benzoatilytica]|uniref:hypothetical protein n=1 Tax=Amycolatopsis benzoatilytica TaxID=346045 RepID=UPI0003709EF4|nr:hypothetical protein [Amycolatopsis benzoatilytica]
MEILLVRGGRREDRFGIRPGVTSGLGSAFGVRDLLTGETQRGVTHRELATFTVPVGFGPFADRRGSSVAEFGGPP